MNNFVPSAVATLIIQNGKVLLGRRLERQHFIGWQCPGGFLLKGESIEQAASRISLEKAGIAIFNMRAGPYSNNIFEGEKNHTTTLYVMAEASNIQNKATYENAKNQWRWFDVQQLPEPLFLPLKNLVMEHKLAEL